MRPTLTNDVLEEGLTTDSLPAEHRSLDDLPMEHRSLDDLQPQHRSLDIFGNNLTSLFSEGLDMVGVGRAVVLVVSVLLMYDLVVYLLAPTSSRKRLLMTPWLVQILSGAWDNLGQRGSFARSLDDTVGPVLHSLATTAAKYEHNWERSRLL
ncbi:hypothetical protein Pmani_015422 [Petrolisthes manimaculis]|uniref:Uncharacterized protein n=2 Tax=Petrolisthes manimaculis TaxID=1843537 RepID=A0AAE1PR05_9EUCA|nr:hypothetical protein Pmani_015422 [Petrolisthes manimaculis]